MPDGPQHWPRWFSSLNTLRSENEALRREHGEDAAVRVRRARAFIDAHYAEPIELEGIAAQANLSQFHFIRRFKHTYGTTPHQYLTKVRLQNARRLLERSGRSVTEVCLDVGFSSLGSFSTLFSRHVGTSPANYRRRMVTVSEPLVVPIPACFMSFWGTAIFEKRAEARGDTLRL